MRRRRPMKRRELATLTPLRERGRVPRPAASEAGGLPQFARSSRGSNVAFRGITPDPATAIQAVTGSGVDAGQVGGTRTIKKDNFLNVDRQQRQAVRRPRKSN